jgi:hypothetical protein
MNPDHAHFAEWDSAYVLGSLAPAERRAYEEHLESCELCRRSVAELAPMPGLLARLTPERASALLDEPAVAGGPRPEMLDAVRREGRSRRVRRTRLRFALAAAAVAVVLAAVLVPVAFLRPAAEAQDIAFEVVADVPVSASATLTTADWGTRIELDCHYRDVGASGPYIAPDDGWRYALFVVGNDGSRSEVSSWQVSPGTRARLAAGTALELDDIESLEIRSVTTNEVLLLGRTG